MTYISNEEKRAIRKEKAKLYAKRFRDKINSNPILKDKQLSYQKKYRADHPEMFNREMALKYKLAREYGISLELYKAINKEQNGVCAICFNAPENKRLAVDHDHQTNKVRGLLCYSCNTALGLMKDNFTLFENAIKYLKYSQKQVETITEHLKTTKEHQTVFNPPKLYINIKPLN